MRFLLFALRNIPRNKRRSATVLLMLALGATAQLLAGGYAAATFRGLRETTIRNGLGHIQIGGPGFRAEEDKPLATGLSEVEHVRAIVRADTRVRAAAARIEFNGLVSNGEKSVVFLGRGVEPGQEYDAAGFSLAMRSGRVLTDTSEDEAVVAIGLARSLRVSPGDRLTLLSQTVDGALNGADVLIVGTYTTGIREMDERALIVPLKTAQRILDTSKVSKLIVVLNRTADTDAVQTSLAGALDVARKNGVGPPSPKASASLDEAPTSGVGQVELANWSDLAAFYHQVRGLYSGIFLFLGIIIVSLVVVSTGNAMNMAVLERVKEIGTLMALGTSRWIVMLMFVAEGVALGALGSGIGAVLGYGLARFLTEAGIMLPPPPTFTSGFPLTIDIVPALWLAVPVVMTATLFVASVLPAARAARLKIVDALGHS